MYIFLVISHEPITNIPYGEVFGGTGGGIKFGGNHREALLET